MKAEKFNKDFEFYKKNLSKKLDERTVTLMLHAYCMGYCELSNHLNEEFETMIMINPVLDKITELGPKIKQYFNN